MHELMRLRVIKHGQASPFYNMAVDEAVSGLCGDNNFTPVLRFTDGMTVRINGLFSKIKEIQQNSRMIKNILS